MSIEHRWVHVNGVGLHAAVAGAGTPIVLLHGWPVTWYHWRGVIPLLARRHLVLAPDLRGLGDSERAPDGYDKRTLAQDIAELADLLGLERFAVVGHDFGGSVAYALAAAYPDRVTHLVVAEELLPGVAVPASLVSPRYPRWHNAFHAVPDVPEMLIPAREPDYLNVFWALTAPGRPLPAHVIEEYARTYLRPGTLRTGLAYYRTAAQDAEWNRRAATHPLRTPALAIGGDAAMGSAVEACLSQVAASVSGVVIEACGHYPAEEQPARVADLMAAFIG